MSAYELDDWDGSYTDYCWCPEHGIIDNPYYKNGVAMCPDCDEPLEKMSESEVE